MQNHVTKHMAPHHTEVRADGGDVRAFETSVGDARTAYVVEAFDQHLHSEQALVGLVSETTIKVSKGDDFAEREVKAARTASDSKTIVLRSGEQVVGLAIVKSVKPGGRRGGWQVRLVLVQDDHRRRGLSQVLVDEMQLNFMKPTGGDRMSIDLPTCLTSPSARQLWVRNGCEEPELNGVETRDGEAFSKGLVSMEEP